MPISLRRLKTVILIVLLMTTMETMASTATKPEAGVLTIEELREVVESVDIPVVAIGGVNAQTIPGLFGMGLAGYSIVSAIIAADDIEAASRELRSLIDEGERA